MYNAEKRITLFADSLALPRGEDWGNTPFEETYPYLLEKNLRSIQGYESHIFINRAQRFRTMIKTLNDLEDFALFPASEIVIIHCGIVDCAPRVFSESQRAWIENIPDIARSLVLKLVHVFRGIIIKYFMNNKTYVTLDAYEQAIKNIKAKTIHAKKIIFVNIIEPSAAFEDRSPGFKKNVHDYNKIIRAAACDNKTHMIDINSYIQSHGGPDVLTVDGMHINKIAHDYLAKEIVKLVAA